MNDSPGWKRWLDLRARPFGAGLTHGLVFALSWIIAFPGIGIWPLVVVGPAALTRAAIQTRRPLRTALGASVGSIPLWAWSHAFIIDISAAGYVPLVIHLSIYPGLFVWLCARLRIARPDLPRWILLPIVWIGIEVLRGELLWNGYPWFLVAHPLLPLGALTDYASVVGVYGVGAMVMATIGWVFDFVEWQPKKDEASLKRGKHLRLVAISGALVFFLGAALLWPHLGADRDTVLVSIVQTNLPQSNKMRWSMAERERDLTRFLELTTLAASAKIGGIERGKPDLIVWPETMFPGSVGLSPESIDTARSQGILFEGAPAGAMHDALVARQASIGIPMIVGAVAFEGLRFEPVGDGLRQNFDAFYNSAFVVDGGQVQPDRYDKMHLTPFGEVMPYISSWPWLEQKLLDLGARGMTFDLEAGREADPIIVPLAERGEREALELPVAAPICFEATMTQVCRDLVYRNGARQARLLVNLTNDGWYGWYRGGRTHHLLHARWRCVELGTPMVRAANTGISALIDARGKVVARGVNMPESRQAIGSEGVLYGEVRLPESDHATIYARLGNAVGWSLLGALVVLTGLSLVKRRQATDGNGEPDEPALRLVGGGAQADEPQGEGAPSARPTPTTGGTKSSDIDDDATKT